MKGNTVIPNNLRTIKNYAHLVGVAPTYVYRLIREEILESVDIDGVSFVDITKYPELPSKKANRS